MGTGADDPRNASAAMRELTGELGPLIRAAVEVVQDHVSDCQRSLLRAERHVQKRACDRYGGVAEAWRYFAAPAVLDLAAALRRLQGPPSTRCEPPPRVVPADPPPGALMAPTNRPLP